MALPPGWPRKQFSAEAAWPRRRNALDRAESGRLAEAPPLVHRAQAAFAPSLACFGGLRIPQFGGGVADVFLSYKKEDRAKAERAVAALEAAGYSVWWDDDLTPRNSWDAEIEREIAAAKAVLVLWPPRARETHTPKRARSAPAGREGRPCCGAEQPHGTVRANPPPPRVMLDMHIFRSVCEVGEVDQIRGAGMYSADKRGHVWRARHRGACPVTCGP